MNTTDAARGLARLANFSRRLARNAEARGDEDTAEHWRHRSKEMLASAAALCSQGVPSYSSVHTQLWRKRGSASLHRCEVCSEQAQTWALTESDDELIGLNQDNDGLWYVLRYSLDLGAYRHLCLAHHRQLDVEYRERER